MDKIYENIEEYSPTKECKILIAFDDMTVELCSNRKHKQTIVESFIRGKKLSKFFVFIRQSFLPVPKITRLNSTHYSIKKISKK